MAKEDIVSNEIELTIWDTIFNIHYIGNAKTKYYEYSVGINGRDHTLNLLPNQRKQIEDKIESLL